MRTSVFNSCYHELFYIEKFPSKKKNRIENCVRRLRELSTDSNNFLREVYDLKANLIVLSSTLKKN